jgi:hypothetical protein
MDIMTDIIIMAVVGDQTAVVTVVVTEAAVVEETVVAVEVASNKSA